jgi:hypothetical protein
VEEQGGRSFRFWREGQFQPDGNMPWNCYFKPDGPQQSTGGVGGIPETPKRPENEKFKVCSSGEAPSDPRARDITQTVFGGGFGRVPVIRYQYSIPADAAARPSESVVQGTVIAGAEIGGATGGWLGTNFFGSWAAHHVGRSGAIVGVMITAEGLGSGALLGSAGGGVLGALVGLIIGAAADEAHETRCE